jgi:DUF1016 N-terminal domain
MAKHKAQKKSLAPHRQAAVGGIASLPQADFDEVLRLIDAARTRALAAVNQELVGLYWQIGEYISRKPETAAWGEGWSSSWPITSPGRTRTSRASPDATFSGCIRLPRRTELAQQGGQLRLRLAERDVGQSTLPPAEGVQHQQGLVGRPLVTLFPDAQLVELP